MGNRVIANQQVWVGFATSLTTYTAPTAAEVTAAKNLTKYLVSFEASTKGNTVQTPSLDQLFEQSISGTVQATVQTQFYRENGSTGSDDVAWKTLPRGTTGYFIVKWLNADGSVGSTAPATGTKVDVWPVTVTARSMQQLANNTSEQFMCEFSVPQVPAEDVAVA